MFSKYHQYLQEELNAMNQNNDLVINEEFNIECLEEHNYLRSLHGVKPLAMNTDLAERAQSHAERLALLNKLEHSSDDTYGESIGTRYSRDNCTITGKQAALMWYSEIVNYNFEEENQLRCGHFSQVVWASTTDAGFGVAKTADGTKCYVVATYYPPGNYTNEWVDNIPPPLCGRIYVPTPMEMGDSAASEAKNEKKDMHTKDIENLVDTFDMGDDSTLMSDKEKSKTYPKHNDQLRMSDSVMMDAEMKKKDLKNKSNTNPMDKYRMSDSSVSFDEIKNKEENAKNIANFLESLEMSDDTENQYSRNNRSSYQSTEISGSYSLATGHLGNTVEDVNHEGIIVPYDGITGDMVRSLEKEERNKASRVMWRFKQDATATYGKQKNHKVYKVSTRYFDPGQSNGFNIRDEVKWYDRSTDKEIDMQNIFKEKYIGNEILLKDDLIEFREDVILLHNRLRRVHGQSELEQDLTLDSMAQEWAEHCLKKGKPMYSDWKYNGLPLGENVSLRTIMFDHISAEQLMGRWVDLAEGYDYENEPQNVQKSGHYTQVIWKGTKYIGVGRARCQKLSQAYVVVFYYPPGNEDYKFCQNIAPVIANTRL